MMLVVLALLGLMVLVVTVSPPNPGTDVKGRERAAASPRATPPLSDPDAFDVTATLSAAPGAPVETIEAELGDRVEIVVEGRDAESVALGDMRTEPLEAGLPARFELLAETPGT